jgi:hypothetical protein
VKFKACLGRSRFRCDFDYDGIGDLCKMLTHHRFLANVLHSPALRTINDLILFDTVDNIVFSVVASRTVGAYVESFSQFVYVASSNEMSDEYSAFGLPTVRLYSRPF